jgi:Protein of unknown function (DUF2809)
LVIVNLRWAVTVAAVTDRTWRVRAVAVAFACGLLAVALRIRQVVPGSATAQFSGTALYASLVYAGVFVLRPRTTPMVAGAWAIGFCWLVECLQLTGLPADLSRHSLVARLVLGVQFDPVDLAWYPAGVVPLVALQLWACRGR